MIDSCIQRTDGSFQSWLKKTGVPFISTDYIMPTEMCAMVNVMLDAKNQSFKLCSVEGIDLVRRELLTKKINNFLKNERTFLVSIPRENRQVDRYNNEFHD